MKGLNFVRKNQIGFIGIMLKAMLNLIFLYAFIKS